MCCPALHRGVLNLCGLLFFAFFLSISLASLMPFRCALNPDGSSSMVSDPGIICYNSEEHSILVILAVAGILSQPAMILAWTTFATLMYPTRVSSGSGLRQVNRYRFLFHRFKPQSYYFGVFLLYRNGIVALLPAMSSRILELQVPAMGSILLASLALQARTYPWRTEQANVAALAAGTLGIPFERHSLEERLDRLMCTVLFGHPCRSCMLGGRCKPMQCVMKGGTALGL